MPLEPCQQYYSTQVLDYLLRQLAFVGLLCWVVLSSVYLGETNKEPNDADNRVLHPDTLHNTCVGGMPSHVARYIQCTMSRPAFISSSLLFPTMGIAVDRPRGPMVRSQPTTVDRYSSPSLTRTGPTAVGKLRLTEDALLTSASFRWMQSKNSGGPGPSVATSAAVPSRASPLGVAAAAPYLLVTLITKQWHSTGRIHYNCPVSRTQDC